MLLYQYIKCHRFVSVFRLKFIRNYPVYRHTVNSFERETTVNCVTVYIIAVLLLALPYKLIIKQLKINVWISINNIDSNCWSQ